MWNKFFVCQFCQESCHEAINILFQGEYKGLTPTLTFQSNTTRQHPETDHMPQRQRGSDTNRIIRKRSRSTSLQMSNRLSRDELLPQLGTSVFEDLFEANVSKNL